MCVCVYMNMYNAYGGAAHEEREGRHPHLGPTEVLHLDHHDGHEHLPEGRRYKKEETITHRIVMFSMSTYIYIYI